MTGSSDDDWLLAVGVKVEAPFRICRAAIPIMVVFLVSDSARHICGALVEVNGGKAMS